MPLPASATGLPPAPLVLAEELLTGPPDAVELLSGRLGHVIGQVLSTRPVEALTPADRARAAALATSWRTGALSRATATWVWSGSYLAAPDVVDVGTVVLPSPLSDLEVVGTSTLRTQTVRCSGVTAVVRVGGVAVTDPGSTASECARLLPPAQARACLVALHRSGRVPLQHAVELLRQDSGSRGRRAGLALAEQLLERLVAADGGAARAA